MKRIVDYKAVQTIVNDVTLMYSVAFIGFYTSTRQKTTTNATLASTTQAEKMMEVAVVMYARDIRIGKARDKG